jgi:ferredoxin
VKVWIDQDLCTGDGICVEICPPLFGMHDDGLAYVKEADWPTIYGPDGAAKGDPALQMVEGMAMIPEADLEAAIEAAEECPGECIFIEVG